MKVLRFISVLLFASILVINADNLYADENKTAQIDYKTLLKAYSDNDRQLKELTLSFEQAELSYQKVLIQNGTSWNLSSGSMNAKIAENGTTVSVSPAASISLPALNNSQIKITS
ncbi:MAG TPA: hypothetical protein PLG87_09255, partial [Treponemataceae bacterium]|nr:hypothetical protein [Treponemataceae bacterium]